MAKRGELMKISEAAKRAVASIAYNYTPDGVLKDADVYESYIQQAIDEATAELKNEYAGALAECDASHEIQRQLKAEIERLNEVQTKGCDCDPDDACRFARERDEAKAEIARMRDTLESQGRNHTQPCGYGSMCPWCEIEDLRAQSRNLRGLISEIREHRGVMEKNTNAVMQVVSQTNEENASLRVALDLLENDMHQFGPRPCPTCDQVTRLIGRPFGCEVARARKNGKED